MQTGFSGAVTVLDEPAAQAALAAVNDAGCRAILQATDGVGRSASDIGEVCDLPLSTTYRKLDLLSDANLIREKLRVRADGKHYHEYERRVEAVYVGFDGPDGTRVAVTTDGTVSQAVVRPDERG